MKSELICVDKIYTFLKIVRQTNTEISAIWGTEFISEAKIWS